MGKKERNDRTIIIIESSDEYSAANDGRRRRAATVLPADATGTTAVPTSSGSISATTTIVFFTTRCVGVSARGCESDGGGAAGGTAAAILRAATSGERERIHPTVLVRRVRRRVGGDCPEIFSREEARHAVDDDATDDEAVYESSGRDAGGMPGGMPGMPGGMPGMPGSGDAFPPFPGMQQPPPPPKPAATTQRYTDTTATPVTPPPSSSSSAASTPSSSKRGSATKTVDTVSDIEEEKAEEPELTWVGESSSSSSSSTQEAPKKSFFEDTVETEASTSSSSSSPFQDAADMPDEEDDEASLEYMKNMIRNPEMQKLMYPYLPEFMRNSETFEMLLNNPQYKDQLKGIMKSMKSSGAMPGAGMGGMGGGAMPDINSPEVQEQFAQMGMKPEDVLTQIMQDPELASAFQNPKVQAAVMDCSANPMNITKYQNDPEVMKTFEKLASLFPQAGGGAPPPGMF